MAGQNEGNLKDIERFLDWSEESGRPKPPVPQSPFESKLPPLGEEAKAMESLSLPPAAVEGAPPAGGGGPAAGAPGGKPPTARRPSGVNQAAAAAAAAAGSKTGPDAGDDQGPQSNKAKKAAKKAAKQAQRAAQREGGGGKPGAGAAPSGAGGPKAAGAGAPEGKPVRRQRRSTVFAHLVPESEGQRLWHRVIAGTRRMHPLVLRLGHQYQHGVIVGGNARCLAMLIALEACVRDYSGPAQNEALCRDLDRYLKAQFEYLTTRRPHSITMANTFRQIRRLVSCIPPNLPLQEANEHVIRHMQEQREKMSAAVHRIADLAAAKVDEGDVVLTYARSSTVNMALVRAAEAGKSFRVVVADARPHLEGRASLEQLVEAGIPCTYVSLNAANYMMASVTKVFLGAAAMFSNGSMQGRVGSALIALVANAYGKPVLVLTSTLKFTDKVALDSIGFNESGPMRNKPPAAIQADKQGAAAGSKTPPPDGVSFSYDVTPIHLISALVTEVGMIAPTSVPAVLREQSELQQE